MLKFDEARLFETAKAVQAVNPHARNYPIESLVEHMKATAHRTFGDGGHGYVSTLGFVLSLFTNDDGSREIHSSVASYGVNQFVKTLQGK